MLDSEVAALRHTNKTMHDNLEGIELRLIAMTAERDLNLQRAFDLSELMTKLDRSHSQQSHEVAHLRSLATRRGPALRSVREDTEWSCMDSYVQRSEEHT